MSDIMVSNYYDPGIEWDETAHRGAWRLYVKRARGRDVCSGCRFGMDAAVLGSEEDLSRVLGWAAKGDVSKLSLAIRGETCGIVLFEDGFAAFRDKLGCIPLVMIERERGVVVTTAPEIVCDATRGLALNEAWVVHYLRVESSLGLEDICEGQTRIPPGGCYIQRGAKCGVVRYWPTPSFFEPIQLKHIEDGIDQLRESLEKAVLRIPKDKPLVYSLSGGLDSGGIVGISCAHSSHKLKTVSLISQKYASSDESHELGVLASALPLDMTYINMEDVPSLSNRVLYRHDAFCPTVLPGAETTYALFEAAARIAQGARLVVGHNGNALVYEDNETVLLDLLRRRDLAGLMKEAFSASKADYVNLARRMLRGALGGRLRLTLKRALPKRMAERFFVQTNVWDSLGDWLTPIAQSAHPFVRFASMLGPDTAHMRASIVQSWRNELSMRIMCKFEHMTGVVVHDPLCDPNLYELCARLPAKLFLNCGKSRWGYREALKPFLPSEIIEHPKVKTFTEPVEDHFTTPENRAWIEASIESMRDSELKKYIDFEALLCGYVRCADNMAAGQRPDFAAFCKLWRAMSLCL